MCPMVFDWRVMKKNKKEEKREEDNIIEIFKFIFLSFWVGNWTLGAFSQSCSHTLVQVAILNATHPYTESTPVLSDACLHIRRLLSRMPPITSQNIGGIVFLGKKRSIVPFYNPIGQDAIWAVDVIASGETAWDTTMYAYIYIHYIHTIYSRMRYAFDK